MTFFGIFKIGPLEPCRNEFQSTGSHRLTVCTSTDSYYYFSAYTWGQKRNTFPQGSSGPIFKIPKKVISYEPKEPTFEWAKLFCDISLTLMCMHHAKVVLNRYILSNHISHNRWYPEVGKAPPPNLNLSRGRTDTVNRKYNPKSGKR